MKTKEQTTIDMKIDIDWAWQAFEPTDERAWDCALAAHLYRRAGLGADATTLDAAVTKRPSEVVEELFSIGKAETDFRTTADALARTILASGNTKRLSAAWVYRLVSTPSPVVEKLTLFWHGHFATSAEKVDSAKLMWTQNELLRTHAIGDFSALTRAISRDPAMLIYLDSAINRKARPNENFARELMELFCLGEGNYSERDVQELARCFTGWEIRADRFRINRYQHDEGMKSFLGQTEIVDGEDAVDVVLSQPAVELFLARKWYRFFIADEPSPSDELLRPLAKVLRENDLQVAPALKMLLSSNLFFSEHSVGRKIKSPVDLVIGTLRSLRATANADLVAEGLLKVGQGLFYPPNVKGWEGGRAWINSSTLLGRANLFAQILADDATRFGGKSLADYLGDCDVKDSESAVEHFETCLLPSRLDAETKQQLIAATESETEDRERGLRSLLHAFTALPQCQLG